MAPLSSYLFFLPFLGVSALSLTPRADCSADVTWSVTGLKLIDAATPNLITLKADRRRTLEFLVSSPTLPEPLQCIGDTGTYRSDTVRQFNTWTYNCWEGDSITPDATLAFQFESAFADEAKSHPAKVQLKQRCGSGEAQGSAEISTSCKMPDGCPGPCFDRECDVASFTVTASFHSG